MAIQTVKEYKMIISYEENGVSIDREATDSEAAYIKSAQAEATEAKKAELAEANALKNARSAVLTKLGITAEEASLLLS
jgi:hypothetical protein